MIEFTTRITEHGGRSRILRSIIASGVLLLTTFGSAHAQTSFVETGAARGIGAFDHAAGMTAGMAAADYDNDGNIDLFVPAGDGSRGRLYRNTGVGIFDENRMFHNQCDGTFIDHGVALGMGNYEQNDMGVAVGDIDADGDLDLFVSNIYSGENRRNHLYRNDSTPGRLVFQEIANSAGVVNSGWGWGVTFADVDRDGRDDLLVTNGFIGNPDPSRLFQRQPGAPTTFVDIAPSAGFNDVHWGSALLAVDIDRDDDLDVFQACIEGSLRVLENRTVGGGAGLTVRPRMTHGANRFAIGALVQVELDGRKRARGILAGSSIAGQEPAEALFGLGDQTVADRVTVRWPDGSESAVGGVEADTILDIDERTIFSDGLESGTIAGWSGSAR